MRHEMNGLVTQGRDDELSMQMLADSQQSNEQLMSNNGAAASKSFVPESMRKQLRGISPLGVVMGRLAIEE